MTTALSRGFAVAVSQKGLVKLKLTARGRAGHAARPHQADNAIVRAALSAKASGGLPAARRARASKRVAGPLRGALGACRDAPRPGVEGADGIARDGVAAFAEEDREDL